MANRPYKDMTGERYGELTVLRKVSRPSNLRDKQTCFWECECSCGNKIVASRKTLVNGKVKRCKACRIQYLKSIAKQHGMAGTRIYRIWHDMIHRCENHKFASYRLYGGRGIQVCNRWKEFSNFYDDMISSYEDGLQLDRIDNYKGYSKENCRWVTPSQNMRNLRENVYVTWNGTKKLVTDWCKDYSYYIYRQIKKHRFDGTMLIEGGKYDNTKWMEERGRL